MNLDESTIVREYNGIKVAQPLNKTHVWDIYTTDKVYLGTIYLKNFMWRDKQHFTAYAATKYKVDPDLFDVPVTMLSEWDDFEKAIASLVDNYPGQTT